jgi:hypothetical protein
MSGRYVRNPKTGRAIAVGGKTHADLLAAGVRSFAPAAAPKKGRYYQAPRTIDMTEYNEIAHGRRATPRGLAEEVAGARNRNGRALPVAYAAKLRRLEANAGKGRGSALRGWSAVKPRTQGQRRALFAKCGQKCFLARPIETKTGKTLLKFPICGMNSCSPDPRGILAAQTRARGTATRLRNVGRGKEGDEYASIYANALLLRQRRQIWETKK